MDEVQAAAEVVARDMLRVRRGETVLVYGDDGSDPRVVRATADAVAARGGNPLEAWYRIRGDVGTEPPRSFADAMRSSDAMVEYARTYLITTRAFQRAMDAGSRLLCLTAMDSDMMVRCIGRVPFGALKRFGTALAKMTEKARRVRVTSPGGSEFSFELGRRPVILDTGECLTRGRDSYLGGQISWAAVEPTVEGTIALDGTVWPPDALAPLKETILLEVRRGRVESIEGGDAGRELERWIRHFQDRRMYNVAHFCFGFNPGAGITGRILEDERAFGAFVTGFGSQMASFHGGLTLAKSHIDGVTTKPSVWFDGTLVEEGGSFVHPRLAPLEAALRKGSAP